MSPVAHCIHRGQPLLATVGHCGSVFGARSASVSNQSQRFQARRKPQATRTRVRNALETLMGEGKKNLPWLRCTDPSGILFFSEVIEFWTLRWIPWRFTQTRFDLFFHYQIHLIICCAPIPPDHHAMGAGPSDDAAQRGEGRKGFPCVMSACCGGSMHGC